MSYITLGLDAMVSFVTGGIVYVAVVFAAGVLAGGVIAAANTLP